MEKKDIISLPLEIFYTSNKKMRLNLNQYRNAHYFTLSSVKNDFNRQVDTLLKNIKPITSRVILNYTLFPSRKSDVNNVCSIVDKFFEDLLVIKKILPDDNCEIVVGSIFSFGGYDKVNPRCEVEILSIESSEFLFKKVLSFEEKPKIPLRRKKG